MGGASVEKRQELNLSDRCTPWSDTPNATWQMLCEALHELETHPDDTDSRERVVELLDGLASWLRKGGFPPTVVHAHRSEEHA